MLLNSPSGAAHIRRVSPRWGSMGIVALRFYKYFAPLELKSQLIFYKKYNNLRRDTKRRSERDSSGTTKRMKCAKVMERIARREHTHKCRRHAVEVCEAARPIF
jgi:hypothetical protein